MSRSQRLVVCFGALVSSVMADVPASAQVDVPVVFVSRELGPTPQSDMRRLPVEAARSGRLLVLETDGSVRVLVDASRAGAPEGAPTDVLNPDVSFDASRILFSGYSESEKAWRIFEIGVDGENLRQITHSDRQVDLSKHGEAASLLEGYDDVDPCHMPDGRICFVSTRYPEIAPDGRVRATNLYVVNSDGTDLHRITTERFGADTPTIEPSTGRIVYSRWWRSGQTNVLSVGEEVEPVPPGSPGYEIDFDFDPSDFVMLGINQEDFPGVNSWFLAGINPDGTDLAMFAGFRIDRELTQAYRPSFREDGSAIALFIPETPLYGYPLGDGLRSFRHGFGEPESLGGPQGFERDDVEDPAMLAPPFFYASAIALPGREELLVTAFPMHTPQDDYGIYLQSGRETPTLVYNVPESAELDAVPLVERTVPPVVDDDVTDRLSNEIPQSVEEAFELGGKFTFKVENIFTNAPVDEAIVNAPPIGRKLDIEFWMNPQRTNPLAGDSPLLIQRMRVPTDGSIEVELPAGVPLFEVLKRPDDSIALGRDGQIFHVGGMNFGHAGTTSRCVGCHAGHTQLEVLDDDEAIRWSNVAPSATVSASGVRTERGQEEDAFKVANLVDRRTDGLSSQWAASRGQNSAELTLRWGSQIRARELVLYAPESGSGRYGDTDQTIDGAGVKAFLQGQIVGEFETEQRISPQGTRVPFDSTIDFDRLTLIVDGSDVSGSYEGLGSPALAEIEVIGLATGDPRLTFLRSDSSCDGRLDISDAIITLVHLFLGGGACCEAAMDANADDRVDISDPIFSLGFLFLGGARPGEPFPACGTTGDSPLLCEIESCFN